MSSNPGKKTVDPAELTAAIVAEMRAERAARSMTLEELAEAAHMPPRKIQRIFSQESKLFATDMIMMAAALKVDVVDLVERARRRASQ